MGQADGPLAPEHYRQLAAANERAKKIRNAAGVAAFNGWATAILAILSAPFGMSGLLVTAGLSVIAFNELRGRRRLLAYDPSAATLLGWNQVGLLAMITVYCVWMLFSGISGEGALAAELKTHPELAEAIGSLDGFDALYKLAVVAIYGTVIGLSAVFQGLNALYYFTRRKYVLSYVQETPGWVIELQRTT